MSIINTIIRLLDTYNPTSWVNDSTDITAVALNNQENGLSVLGQEAGSHTQVGDTIMFAGQTLPDGWLWCDGASYSTTTYAALYAVISTNYGSGTGTFKVPDMRGVFPRFNDDGKGYDSGRTLGSYQADANKNHVHTYIDSYNNSSTGMDHGSNGSSAYSGANDGTQNSDTQGGSEGRPINIAMGYIIKYK